MRYTVLTFRTFHNRITKDLGVLVGAALIATLGLPSAAQAQVPNSMAGDGGSCTTDDVTDFTINWTLNDRTCSDGPRQLDRDTHQAKQRNNRGGSVHVQSR